MKLTLFLLCIPANSSRENGARPCLSPSPISSCARPTRFVSSRSPPPRCPHYLCDAAQVNPFDFLSASKRYPAVPNVNGDVVPGKDGVGKVVKLGDGVDSLKVGDRVVSVTWPTPLGGTWQQFVSVPASSLEVVPSEVDDVIASQFRINPHTVLGMVAQARKSGLQPGGWLYTDAANSVVGRGLIEISGEENYRVVAVVRRPELLQELKALGAAAVIDTSGVADLATELPALVLAATGNEQVDVAFTAISGPGAAAAAAVVKDNGAVHVYSALSGKDPYILDKDAERGVHLGERYVVFNWLNTLSDDEKARVRDRVWKALEKKQLVTENVKILPLEKAQEALDAVFKPARGEKFLLEG